MYNIPSMMKRLAVTPVAARFGRGVYLKVSGRCTLRRERKRGTEGICAYCGQFREVTGDHIPAQNLFLRPHTHLITVPCCDPCKAGTSLDDEHLRVALAHRSDAAGHPSLAAMMPDIVRGLEKPEAKRFKASLKQRTTPRWFVGHDGIAIPGGIHKVDTRAIDRVIQRVARGLHFHHMLEPMPADLDIFTVPEVTTSPDVGFGNPDIQAMLERVRAEPLKEIGRGEFLYRGWIGGVEEVRMSLWLLTFYWAANFLAIAAPREMIQGIRGEVPSGPMPQ